MDHVLILDVGTGGVHTCLSGPDGKLFANAYEELRYAFDAESKGYELDAAELFESVKRQIKATLSGVDADSVKALAVTSQRHGCVFLDERDEPLIAYPNIDGRAQLLCDDMAAHGPEIFAATARWPACWFPAPRILWTKRHHPERHKQIAGLLMLNEYAVFKLTGRKASEWTNAVETMLFDITSRDWSPTLRALFAAEAIQPTPIIATGESPGELLPAMAGELGLGRIPVVMAASDTQSAALGCGDIRPGDAVAVNGSTTPIFMPVGHFLLDDKRRVYTDPYYGGLWALESNCTMSGIVHRKLMDQLLGLAKRLSGRDRLERKHLYELFEGPDADPEGVTMHWGPIVANVGRAIRLPHLSLYADNDERDIFSAIIPAFAENLAFAIHENVRQLADIAGKEVDTLFLTGGGSASRRLQLALSALNPEKTILLTNELETTSRGAAIQAWMALGRYPDLETAYRNMAVETWTTAIAKHHDDKLLRRHERWLEELDR